MVQPTTAQEGGAATNSGLLGTRRGFRAPSQSVTQTILPGGAPSLDPECDVSGDGSGWKDFFYSSPVSLVGPPNGLELWDVSPRRRTHTKPPPP